ncbi:MAG TPA: DUF5107 domain-containing protein, partial [Chitinophaga sp.]
ENKTGFISLIKNELPAETFAELAIWYYNAGYSKEAAILFGLGPQQAEAICWRCYLQGKKVDCGKINPAFAFPFRSETAAVLEQLLKNQQDWLLKYQLALIYIDRNRVEECKALLTSCGTTPDYAPFYAVRASIFEKDSTQCLSDLQKAVSLDKTQWRYRKLLAEYYIQHQQPAAALAVAAPFYKAHPDQYIMGMLYAKTLLLTKQYKAADGLLSKLNIIPFEGATEGRSLYREAKLMQASEALHQKDYKKAVTYIEAAKLWPESLGVGKPYDDEIDTRLEDWMEYLAGNKKPDALLDHILQFTAKPNPATPNLEAANSLVTAWAMEKRTGKNQAIGWLDAQMEAYPDKKKILEWSKAVFQNDDFPITEAEKNTDMRVLETLKGISR